MEAVSASFNMPVHLGASLSFDCRNSPRPTITVNSGQIILGGVQGLLTLADNTEFAHQVTMPNPPPIVGTGGNPLVYFLFLNGNTPVGTWAGQLLGRCDKI
jgi:hypothetical protein